MTSTTKLFELAQLAEASYANFINSNTSQALTDQNFSLAQATEFVSNWQVVSQQPNTVGGYSGTLFKYIGNDPNSGFANGEYVFSLRGTEPDYIINSTDLAVDLFDIAVDGLAFGQIIDMYNHWTQINTVAGQSYQRAVLLPVNGGVVYPPSSYIVDQPTGTKYAIVFLDSATSYPVGDLRSYGLGAMLQSGGLTVTGHSLGGHLAAAFTRLFPGEASALTINGAGFPTGAIDGISGSASANIHNLFTTLGGGNNFGQITNIFGDKMPQIVTMNSPYGLVQQGSHDTIFIESGSAGNVFGHSSSQMTDSLAVANLFMRLDASFATKTPAQALSKLNTILESGSNQAAKSLEAVVAGLMQYLFGSNKPTITTDDREALYAAIKTLNDGADALNLTGKFTLEASAASASQAHENFGAFLSLYYLTPFALKGIDNASSNKLQAIHQNLADKWNDDRNLTPENLANGEANFSDMYLADRAAMLSWINKRNQDDVEVPAGLNSVFIDKQTDIKLGINTASITVPKYIFGSTNADFIAGGNQADHLYGGAGADTLSGNDGNDWLEGGADADTLMGDKGNDVLIGGAGNDKLDGGDGNDILKGGEGSDTYNFSGSYGIDVITDSDGVGSVTINGNAANSASELVKHIYRNESQKYTYTLLGSGDHQSLVISQDDKTERVVIRDWSTTKKLSVNLQDQALQARAATLSGDFDK